ncbi:pirin family protein [Emcibacter nanhaiensis]|uniref:Pirin family protein n=1 Tax=Emcibacter nanhaiensis TaxID=1505037 RepID=A0A501PPM6_9PROT|nr:pirin family protein [Emcibacter nanhaiensis]TPD61746.1 pirin family protein [Emcibacter nanhaiensis]
MILKRDRNDRGLTTGSWLTSKHSFSFGRYHDPGNMGFGPLRVINEDWIRPGTGFGTHGHENMEIITWVLEGVVSHRDSMGNEVSIGPGEIQLMSAGRGVRHSEYNASDDTELHLLQIWIMPNQVNGEPGYQQRQFADGEFHNSFHLLAAPEGEEQSLSLKQDARIFAGRFDPDVHHVRELNPDRRYWLQVARGELELNGQKGMAGDGFALEEEHGLELAALTATELLLFELPK